MKRFRDSYSMESSAARGASSFSLLVPVLQLGGLRHLWKKVSCPRTPRPDLGSNPVRLIRSPTLQPLGHGAHTFLGSNPRPQSEEQLNK